MWWGGDLVRVLFVEAEVLSLKLIIRMHVCITQKKCGSIGCDVWPCIGWLVKSKIFFFTFCCFKIKRLSFLLCQWWVVSNRRKLRRHATNDLSVTDDKLWPVTDDLNTRQRWFICNKCSLVTGEILSLLELDPKTCKGLLYSCFLFYNKIGRASSLSLKKRFCHH